MYVLIVSNSRIRLYFLPNAILLFLYYRIPKFSWKELVLRDFSVFIWQKNCAHHKATEIRNWTVSIKINIALRIKLLSNFGNKHEQSWVLSTLSYLFQMKPDRCTLLLSIFISTSLHVSGNHGPTIRRNYCICAILVFFTLYEWLSGLLQQPPTATYQCRIDKVSSPDDGHIVARNMYRI
jgi:hypothetical protein